MLSKIDKNIERWALLVFYTMLVATMAIEVLRREIFAYSSIWGEEVVRYSFIYLAWIGAAAAVRERAHIRIDVIFNYIPRVANLR
jgi:TRAP-type C4-dicarboxylate transport system permease small subunit